MSQYDKLDYLIVEAIKQKRNTFQQIDALDVKAESQRLERDMPLGPTGRKPAFRYIDNRLQALRKRGLIEHAKGRGWIAKEAA